MHSQSWTNEQALAKFLVRGNRRDDWHVSARISASVIKPNVAAVLYDHYSLFVWLVKTCTGRAHEVIEE